MTDVRNTWKEVTMDRCPRCGHDLVSEACLLPACVQIELLIEQHELANA